ncbi:MAG: (Fe-S)-binding protein [Acidimicrobiales bacterium]
MAVTLFRTCLVDAVRPQVAKAAASALRRHGHVVEAPRGATCCGQPAWNGGFVAEARRVAARTLKALSRTSGPIVTPSGSCATMIARHWPELFAGTEREADARAVAGRTHELTQFLAPDTADAAAAPAAVGEVGAGDAAVALHHPCHALRELGVKEQPRRLLAAAGWRVVEPPGAERCCGFGGTFSVKLPAVSTAMADDKLDELVASGAGRVAACDLSCLLHLEGRAASRRLPLRFEHVAALLDGPRA